MQNNSAGVWYGKDDVRNNEGEGGAIYMSGNGSTLAGEHHTLNIEVSENTLYTGNTAVMRRYIDKTDTVGYLDLMGNDISIAGNTEARFDVDVSAELRFDGGLFIDGGTYTTADSAGNLTISGGGQVTLGGNSKSYVTGQILVDHDTTLYLEYGALLGRNRSDVVIGTNVGQYVGQFDTANSTGTTVSQQVDYTNGKGYVPFVGIGGIAPPAIKLDMNHSWIYAEKATIDNPQPHSFSVVSLANTGTLEQTSFLLPGVVWQANTVYNLVETPLVDASGESLYITPNFDIDSVDQRLFVTLGLNRGIDETGATRTDGFMSGAIVTNHAKSWASGVNDSYFWRDFVYYLDENDMVLTDASGNLYREFDADHRGNVYAVEIISMGEVIGTDPPYVDPSLKNRILSQRLGWMPRCPQSECGVGDEPECCEAVTRGNAPRKPQWNAWLEGYGTGGNVGNYQGKNGFDYSIGGMLVGIERETSNNSRFGLYYGYGSSWMNGRNIDYRGKAENTFGAYLRVSDRLGYTLLMGNLGHSDYRSNRFVSTALGRETFSAKFGADTSGAYLERGFGRRLSRYTYLTPFAALQYSHLGTGWYDETAVDGSDIRLAQTAKLGYDSLRTLVGARSQTTLRRRLLWNNWAHWEHELLKDGGVVRDEYLTTNSALSARTVGNYGGRDWFILGTGLEFAMTSNLTLNAGYDLSLNKHAVFHTGMAGVTYKF